MSFLIWVGDSFALVSSGMGYRLDVMDEFIEIGRVSSYFGLII